MSTIVLQPQVHIQINKKIKKRPVKTHLRRIAQRERLENDKNASRNSYLQWTESCNHLKNFVFPAFFMDFCPIKSFAIGIFYKVCQNMQQNDSDITSKIEKQYDLNNILINENFGISKDSKQSSLEILKQNHLNNEESEIIEKIANMGTTANEVEKFDDIYTKIQSFKKPIVEAN